MSDQKHNEANPRRRSKWLFGISFLFLIGLVYGVFGFRQQQIRMFEEKIRLLRSEGGANTSQPTNSKHMRQQWESLIKEIKGNILQLPDSIEKIALAEHQRWSKIENIEVARELLNTEFRETEDSTKDADLTLQVELWREFVSSWTPHVNLEPAFQTKVSLGQSKLEDALMRQERDHLLRDMEKTFRECEKLSAQKDKSPSFRENAWRDWLGKFSNQRGLILDAAPRILETEQYLAEATEQRIRQERIDAFLTDYQRISQQVESLPIDIQKDHWHSLLNAHRGIWQLSADAETRFVAARDRYEKSVKAAAQTEALNNLKESYRQILVELEEEIPKKVKLERLELFLSQHSAILSSPAGGELRSEIENRKNNLQSGILEETVANYREQADLALARSDFGSAAVALSGLLKHRPQLVEVRFELAQTLYRRANYGSAIRELNRLLEQNPNHAGAIGLKAIAAAENCDGKDPSVRRELIDHCRQALLDPLLTDDHRNLLMEGLASQLFDSKSEAERNESHQLFTTLAETNASPVAWARVMQLESGKRDIKVVARKALRSLDQAIEEWGSGSPMLYEYRSYAYQQLGKTDKRLADLKKALQLNPDLLWGLLALVEFHYSNKDPEKALEVLNEASERAAGTSRAQVLSQVALHHIHWGDYKKSRSIFAELEKNYPFFDGLDLDYGKKMLDDDVCRNAVVQVVRRSFDIWMKHEVDLIAKVYASSATFNGASKSSEELRSFFDGFHKKYRVVEISSPRSLEPRRINGTTWEVSSSLYFAYILDWTGFQGTYSRYWRVTFTGEEPQIVMEKDTDWKHEGQQPTKKSINQIKELVKTFVETNNRTTYMGKRHIDLYESYVDYYGKQISLQEIYDDQNAYNRVYQYQKWSLTKGPAIRLISPSEGAEVLFDVEFEKAKTQNAKVSAGLVKLLLKVKPASGGFKIYHEARQ